MLGGLAAPHSGEWKPTFHCGEPSCSAFANVSLVLMLTFTERIPVLLGYADWFASELFFLTAHTIDNALRDDPEQCSRCHALTASHRRTGCLCANFYSPLRHVHYGRAFSRAVALANGKHANSSFTADGATTHHAGHRPVQGVLMCHFDFFLNVRIFHGAAFDVPWLPRRGQVTFANGDDPVPRCFPAANGSALWTDKSWFWFEDARPKCSTYLAQLGESECCYGWADILYVPRGMLRLYGTLLSAFPDLHHEVAVPTAMRILSKRLNVTPKALSCNGGTIGRMHNERFGPFVGSPKTYNGFCAHRINLSNTDHQQIVTRFVDERW